jgi:hypothetical protein
MTPWADSLTSGKGNATMFGNPRLPGHAVVAVCVPVGWSLS